MPRHDVDWIKSHPLKYTRVPHALDDLRVLKTESHEWQPTVSESPLRVARQATCVAQTPKYQVAVLPDNKHH